MILSIGYEKLTPAQLAEIARRLDVTVVDCRSLPYGRVKRGFGRDQLAALLGARYTPQGHHLGGRVLSGRFAKVSQGTAAKGLDWIEGQVRAGAALLLLCQEETPGDCHRHHKIARPLAARGFDVVHIYRDELISAASLQAALDEDARTGGDGAEYSTFNMTLADLMEHRSLPEVPETIE